MGRVSGACDILVVGAGPSGLALACDLVRHGVRVRIVDRATRPVGGSRAVLVHPRTLEVLDDLGSAQSLLDEGLYLHEADLFSDDRRIGRLGFDSLDTFFPFVLSVPQVLTETALTRSLESSGVSVERGVAFEGVEQDERRVRARLRTADGKRLEIETSWLVGCDGAGSAVRSAAGIGLLGGTFDEDYVVSDLRVGLEISRDALWVRFSEQGVVVAAPLRDGLHRVWIAVHGGIAQAPQGEPTLDELRALANERGLDGDALTDPGAIYRWRVHHRVADTYRSGRVFLAGDAARVHTPLAGYGMNSGIQEANNLAWKLALVTHGAAPPDLLDSYETERRAVADAVIRAAEIAGRVSRWRNPVGAALRRRVGELLAGLEPVQGRLARSFSGVGLNYRGSSMVSQSAARLFDSRSALNGGRAAPTLEERLEFGGAPHAGDRAVDGTAARVGDEPGRLHDLLRGPHHHLLVFEGAHSEPTWERLGSVERAVGQSYGDWIRVHRVRVATPTSRREADPESLILDPQGDLHHRYGAGAACLYLVRPDGYIGYRAQPPHEHGLLDYLSGIFAESATKD
jgi:2-polyprenyl-6-methoxyphenol hydroxylase-like FAD-dependent oxidoreductase